MLPSVEFHVLGPVTVTSGYESLRIGGPKQRTVLAMLISRAGQSLSADVLASAVYGDDVPERSRRLIQTYVSTLRSVVGDVIAKNSIGWSLVAEPADVDAARCYDLYQSAHGLDPHDAAVVLHDALSIWRGEPYADVEAHGELDSEIMRLVELRVTVLQARIDADLESGRHAELIGELEALVGEHPYQERFRAQHMLALYRSGRQREALRSLGKMREVLVDELGVDPSPNLQNLERRILEQDDSLLGPANQPNRHHESTRQLSTVPVPATALVGRTAELTRIRALMSDHRLVTLSGVGGCGKTRLAIEVARRSIPELEHGAYFADLRSISNDDDVATAVADAVRLVGSGGTPLDRVVEYLVDKAALVVLDNCEHVVQGCAELVTAILRRPGQVRLLVTSRESLDVDGEQLYGVPPMSADDGQAMALFEARASELVPDFFIDDANRASVRELCERLDGLPLAIELAAARTTVLSPVELLSRIDGQFRLLSGGRRRNHDRSRTLEATLDWSYDLLDADEQQLFTSLGVFNGPFDAPAAAAVGEVDPDVVIDLLESLIAKSIVVAERAGPSTRCRLLATVRTYAESHLLRNGQLEAARDRHLDHMLAIAADLKDLDWMATMPNLDAAIDWAVAGERWSDAAELLTAGESRWDELQLGPSKLHRLELVAAALPQDSALRERLYVIEIDFALGAGISMVDAIGAAGRAAMATDDQVRAHGLRGRANILVLTDPEESLRIADVLEQTGGDRDRFSVDSIRAYVHMFAGDYKQALVLCRPYMGLRLPTRDGHAGPGRVYFEVTVAALLLMDGQAADALALANHHPLADRSWNAFGLIAGLSELALGRRLDAERTLISGARSAAFGRVLYASSTSLIGLAAIVHDDGDIDWATEIILAEPEYRLHALVALAQNVAERIGVRDQLVERQHACYFRDRGDARPFLRETLARWDARHSPAPAE